jgi:hypothetical protein
MELQEVFQTNIRDRRLSELPEQHDALQRLENPNLRLFSEEDDHTSGVIIGGEPLMTGLSDEEVDDCFGSTDDEFGAWTSSESGILSGGGDIDQWDI